MANSNFSRGLICAMILLTLLSHPSPVKACSCEEGSTIPEEFAIHDAVFTGKVSRLVDNYSPIFSTLDSLLTKLNFPPYFFDADGRFWGYTVYFKVINSWKGVTTTKVTVDTGYGMGDCGYSFAYGTDYLVYANHAYGEPGNYWVTGTCSRTAETALASEDFVYLNTLQKLPLRPTIQIFLPNGIITFLLLIILVIAMAFLYRRKRHTLQLTVDDERKN